MTDRRRSSEGREKEYRGRSLRSLLSIRSLARSRKNLWGHNVGAAAKLIYHSSAVLRSRASELSGVLASWKEVDMRYGISDMPATENLEEEEEEEERKKKRNKEAMAGSIRRQQ